jgi:site-specific DNA-cytosine methylase
VERPHGTHGAAPHGEGSQDELRYNVVYRVLNAANHGVPQRRERVVFVGFRADLGIEWSFPEHTHSLDALLWDQVRSGEYWDRHEVAARDRLLDPRLLARGRMLIEKPKTAPWLTVRDAIGDLPDPSSRRSWRPSVSTIASRVARVAMSGTPAVRWTSRRRR